MAPTWDEYLVELARYLREQRATLQAGLQGVRPSPARPEGPMPPESQELAARLREECERLIVDVNARMAAIASRAPSRESPHQARPAAYVIADI